MSARKAKPIEESLPPHSVEAEQGVLACIFISPAEAMGECVERFRGGPVVFYDIRHAAIYRAMLALWEKKTGIDVITVQAYLTTEGVLEQVGGIAYLSALPDKTPSAANLDFYADIVCEKYILRLVLGVCASVTLRAREHEGEVDTLLDMAEKCFLDIAQQRETSREMSGREFVQSAIDRIEHYHRGGAQMLGLSTGFPYLDKMTCGMAPGQLIVIAARPGLGKTSLAMNIVEHVGMDLKVPCGVFTMEMTANELGARLMFQRAKADYQRFRTGFFETADLPRLTQAALEIQLAPLWIDETGSLNVLQLRSKARRMVLLHGIKVFVVDYLQLMVPTRYYNNREQEVAEMSSGLKALAKELQVPVIVLAQFNREIEKEPNRKPRLSDLRESGRIEADADVVGMLYKPKLKAPEYEALAGVDPDWAKKWSRVNLMIAKQRNGPTGDVELEFHKAAMRFESHHRPKPGTLMAQPPLEGEPEGGGGQEEQQEL